MKILTLDIGNTAVKGSVFEDGTLLGSAIIDERRAELLREFLLAHDPQGGIACAVGADSDIIIEGVENIVGFKLLRLDRCTPLPIEVEYSSPNTLGLDRVAAAVGAARMSKGALVVDAGTAITLDLVKDNRFLGGNISPGLRLRFRSLNHFTKSLPLVHPEGELPLFGHDTQTAIRSGVVNGVIADIVFALRKAGEIIPSPELLLTGGDARFLAPLLREQGLECRLEPSLVGLGLESIFLYNIRYTASKPVGG